MEPVRRGLASAALGALLGLCFETLHLRAVEAATATTNTGSIRLLERAGFVRAAHLPRAYSVGGRWVDDWLYRLERQEVPRPAPHAG